MPKLPDIHEDDRHIPPISDNTDDDEDSEDQEPKGDPDAILDDDPEEQKDGSYVFNIKGDKENKSSGDFLENLATIVEESTLRDISMDLLELIELDQESRTKRDKQYEEGLRRTGLGDDAPGGAEFNGASRVVHPILAESCIDFASRAIKELFPASGPVKTQIVGKKTEEKLDRADRKAQYLNWQMTTQMQEYRPELEQILTQVPMGGSQYQKFLWDSRIKRARTCFVPIDDILLPYSATDLYTAQRVTHVQHIVRMELESRMDSGLYRELDGSLEVSMGEDQTASAKANDKIEGKEADAYNEDGLRDVFEIFTWLELDEDTISDGALAPYIVTIDKYSEKVLALYRNWEEGDKKLVKLDWIVEWKFIPWRGAYGIGLPHLIGGISASLTGSLRALMDAAMINNSQTLVKLKGGKMSGQNVEVEPTQISEIEGPAGVDDIRKVLMPMPYNPPSTVLFQLLDWLTTAGKGVIATAEESMSNIGDRTPVGTTMAMVEQGSATYSAIHARLHYSQAKALQILSRINGQYLDDEVIVEELDELIVSRADFANSRDIVPVSDPNIFSETQRYAQLQGVFQIRAQFPQLPFDDNALARRMMKRMRVEDVDELLPATKKPQNMNPVAENVAALHGTPLLALPNQDQMAHIVAHMGFASNPVYGGAIMGQKMLPVMIEHVKQHLGFLYSEEMGRVTNFAAQAGKLPTRDLEKLIAGHQKSVMAELDSKLAPIIKGLTQLAAAAQAMAPKPPLDPSVQASTEVAMAEIDRKKQRDSAELQLKETEVQQKPVFEQLKSSTDLQKNEHSNQQHQQTELLKNQGDNETNQYIAAIKMQMDNVMNAMQQRLDQLNSHFDRSQAADEAASAQQVELLKHVTEQATGMQQHSNELDQQGEQHALEQANAMKQHEAEMQQQSEQAAAQPTGGSNE